MYKKRTFLCTFALLLLCLVPHLALAAAKDELAKAVQEKYAGIQAFTATFTQTLFHRDSGTKDERKGELTFKKPRLFRFETKPPFAQLMIANDELIWDYIPDDRVAYQYSLSMLDQSASILNVITGQSRFDADFAVYEEKAEGSLRVLMLFPHEPSTQFVEAKLWIHSKSFFIDRVIITDFYGNTNEMRFEKIVTNPSLPKSRFVFTPPKGVDIEDNREAMQGPSFL